MENNNNMWALKNTRQIDFLYENGLKPEFERYGTAYYKTGKRFRELMDKYYIQYTCIPNGWRV